MTAHSTTPLATIRQPIRPDRKNRARRPQSAKRARCRPYITPRVWVAPPERGLASISAPVTALYRSDGVSTESRLPSRCWISITALAAPGWYSVNPATCAPFHSARAASSSCWIGSAAAVPSAGVSMSARRAKASLKNASSSLG
ncbi:hypothetical protein D3C71_1537200 [compost metagenome]